MLKSQVLSQYHDRRRSLMALDPNACFIFFGAEEVTRSNDTSFPFRQDSQLHYLTEFDEAGAILVLVAGKSHLFVMDRDPNREIWDGERYGTDRAKEVFKVDEAHSVKEFYSKLEELLADADKVFYRLGDRSIPDAIDRDEKILKALHRATRFQGKGSFGHLSIHDPSAILSQMRIIKDESELTTIRKACSISAKAHIQLLKRAKAGMTEFELAAEFQYGVLRNGCTDLGYGTIVASGYNATTLHYVRNNDTLKHGDLVLVDGGGELNCYTADITQTFPVSGAFSLEQKTIYSKVLETNREITSMIKPGVSYRSLHHRSTELLTDALLSLGVLSGTLEENLATHTYRKYYPHGLGHYLGIDVHDAGLYHERGKDFELKAGMLLTNEPGLYFRDRGNPYFGIGVRIEDDILVTENGSEVLTHELPRDISSIENLRSIANS